jgi:hypothetical protein
MIYVAFAPHPAHDLAPHRRATIQRFFTAIQAGDYAVLEEILTADAITRWPQSNEQITGAMACVQVYRNYPGGPPTYRLERVSGDGDVWVAELAADYGNERWHVISLIHFDGLRIAHMTDYFGPSFPAPEWRKELVDVTAAAAG